MARGVLDILIVEWTPDLLAFCRLFRVFWWSAVLFVEWWTVVDARLGDRLKHPASAKRIDRKRWI
jgi:hypothetical protein